MIGTYQNEAIAESNWWPPARLCMIRKVAIEQERLGVIYTITKCGSQVQIHWAYPERACNSCIWGGEGKQLILHQNLRKRGHATPVRFNVIQIVKWPWWGDLVTTVEPPKKRTLWDLPCSVSSKLRGMGIIWGHFGLYTVQRLSAFWRGGSTNFGCIKVPLIIWHWHVAMCCLPLIALLSSVHDNKREYRMVKKSNMTW